MLGSAAVVSTVVHLRMQAPAAAGAETGSHWGQQDLGNLLALGSAAVVSTVVVHLRMRAPAAAVARAGCKRHTGKHRTICLQGVGRCAGMCGTRVAAQHTQGQAPFSYAAASST